MSNFLLYVRSSLISQIIKKQRVTSILILAGIIILPVSSQYAYAQSCPAPTGPGDDCDNDGLSDACELATPQSSRTILDEYGFRTMSRTDCNQNGVFDACEADCDSNGIPNACERDVDQNGTPDNCETLATCSGQCFPAFAVFDEDKDGTPNCLEITDGTNACDPDSFIEHLRAKACGSPNGFLGQVNIASVVNVSPAAIDFIAEYRDQFGVVKSTIPFKLDPNVKQDLILNEEGPNGGMGLKKDTYGILCITATNAQSFGAWKGGITLYKRRNANDTTFDDNTVFDFALYQPFTNPRTKNTTVPINTFFPLKPGATSTVANWIRIFDVPDDGRIIAGKLRFYNANGVKVGGDVLVGQGPEGGFPNGGRRDYSGHEALGKEAVGMVEFIPTSTKTEYYIEAARYFYENELANTFYTAFVVPIQPLSGVKRSAFVKTDPNEFSVVEIINGTASGVDTAFSLLEQSGVNALLNNLPVPVPARATQHIISSNTLNNTSSSSGWAQVSGPAQAINETKLVYGFNPQGTLLYAYAAPLTEPAGTKQVTEFNSFINHTNTLNVVNTSNKIITATISIFDYQKVLISAVQEVFQPREARPLKLNVPKNTYGAIVIDSGADNGLVIDNNVSRPGQYVLPYLAR